MAQHILRPVPSYCGIRSEPLVILNLMVCHDQCGIYHNAVLVRFLQRFLEIIFSFYKTYCSTKPSTVRYSRRIKK